jgi:peptidoglycan/xylan/chitin deacetylase (PgdA/CDA1 family)
VWPERARSALSISFDDARESQPRVLLPLLDRLGVRATFFVLPAAVEGDPVPWREAVAAGHEIGNHTATHPCSANFPWSRGRAIEELTEADFARDVDDAERRIEDALGVTPRVFAYPCGHTFVGRGRATCSVVPQIAARFLAGRTFNDLVANAPFSCDLAQVAAVNVDGMDFPQLQPRLDAAVADRAWLVVGGHEAGRTLAPETTKVATLEALVEQCRARRVWIGTIGAVAERVADAQDELAPKRLA